MLEEITSVIVCFNSYVHIDTFMRVISRICHAEEYYTCRYISSFIHLSVETAQNLGFHPKKYIWLYSRALSISNKILA